MKEFLSIEKFKQLKYLLILEALIFFLLIFLFKDINTNLWDWRVFLIVITTWILCSLFDMKKYWNLATLLTMGSYMYLCFYFIFIYKI